MNNNLQTVSWRELELTEPQYFFVAKDFSLQGEYNNGFSVQELFPVNSVGIVTAKDAVFVNNDKKVLLKNIRDCFDINPDESLIQRINYRPFDIQYVYYDIKRIERARENVMQHFLKGKNVGLLVSRQCVNEWRYIFVSRKITEFNLTGTAGRFGSGYVFPLYLYPETDKLFSDEKRKSNLNEKIIDDISQRIGARFTDEKNYPPLEGCPKDGVVDTRCLNINHPLPPPKEGNFFRR